MNAIGSRPTLASERIPLLDAVRGIALGGILLANLMSFFGADMIDASSRRAMAWGDAGEAVLFGINWLVEGKFYSIFSMLLGVGFALQLARSPRPRVFDAFFRRRMTVLIAIGLTHMYLLWAGDILTLYGVMGLLLPALFRMPDRPRTAVMIALFSVPLLTHVMVNWSDGRLNPRTPFAAAALEVRRHFGIADRAPLEAFAHDGPASYWAWNTSTAVTRPGAYLQSGRPAKVLALFLLGAWVGASVLPRLNRIREALIITVAIGGTIGLMASFVYASIKASTGSTFLMSPVGLIQTAAYTLGTTPLALAYLAAAALAWRTIAGRAALEWFVPLGRMALTVYLTQSLIQLALFSGYGFGLAGRVPIALLPPTAIAILVAQRYTCAWWLRNYVQGPMEYVWRRATYGATG